jgi:hypothetical protein
MQKTKTPLTLRHIEELALPAPQNLPKLTHENPDQAPDLFLWCVDDITLKLMRQDAEIPENFRDNLYRSIFADTLNIAFKEFSELGYESDTDFTSYETLEEVIVQITTMLEAKPELGFIFNKSLVTAYLTKCMDYATAADTYMSSLLYN